MPRAAKPKAPRFAKAGHTIGRTDALDKYKLDKFELDELTMLFEGPNRHGSYTKIYNEYEVQQLALRLGKNVDHLAEVPPMREIELSPKKGKQILYSNAMTEYRLNADDMKEISPISIRSNPNSPKYQTKHYNLCDVEDLAASKGKTKKSPTQKSLPASPASSPSRDKPSRELAHFPDRPVKKQPIDLDSD